VVAPGGRDIDHAGIRAARAAGAGPPCPAARRRHRRARPCRRRHSAMAWLSSKMITPSKSEPQPVDDLVDAGFLPAFVGAQRGIGGEKDALGQRDVAPLREARQRRDQQPLLPSADQSRCASSSSLSLFEIQSALRRPWQPVVEQDPGRLAALARAGAIAEEEAAAEADGVRASSGAAETMSKVSSTVHDPAR
jgi:hypothetical protein